MTHAAALNYTLRQPLGVVGLISPWNLPLYLLSWKVAPAIAAGNTCVAKPSELTPLTANRLAELSIEVGIPPGVINIVHGYGNKAGRALTCHDDVAAISFTGGTVTGAAVAANAAPRFKKLSLELGGKNPNLIFADADLDDAIATSIRSSFWNQGEICLCGSRIFVERSATVWTRDLSRAHRVAAALDAGTIWVNCWLLRDLRVPFGGMKESGIGREGGFESLNFFTEAKNVCVRISS